MALPVSDVALAPKSLLLFGPGVMSLDKEYLDRILSINKGRTTDQWALHALEDIQSCWGSLCEWIPKLQSTPGERHAQTLAEWLRTGVIPPSSTVANLPNSILGPLVIVAQLVEYLEHMNTSTHGSVQDEDEFQVHSGQDTETIGCCLGVFSALVVSLSTSWAQFFHNAGAVLRNVFVLGALSDAQDVSKATGASVSFMVFWRGGQSISDLNKMLEAYPESYVSVLYDDNRATVTTSCRTAPALNSHFQKLGITATETEFHGRFHAGRLYEADIQALFSFCHHIKASGRRVLPDASCLVLPTRINRDTTVSKGENLLEVASRAFFVEQFDWIKTLRSSVSGSLADRTSRIIEFGPERCVPPTLLRRLKNQIIHVNLESTSRRLGHSSSSTSEPKVADNDIAVIGMACNVAGAQDLEEYWKILLEGKSQHKELDANDRFVMETSYRPHQKGDEKKKWYGNFLDEHDAFDHKFFKKSPREALHMDPQQRLMLQVAYQAVTQSGYHHKSQTNDRIGCYIGCVGNDYENNIAHTTPNAFSATGVLRCYIAGKVSHYFGWTGPSMTLDTACSASTVAMNLACQAIISGECSAALVGGTNFCSAPLFFQNLAAGSFLSPTGQCKPFDKDADGYCRGEAIGAIFLKKLSDAIPEGYQILGVVSATAINQNQNTTPIFVPNPLSLTEAFRSVLCKSGLEAKDISYVEAHGTGTPVGDPAEYDSIRQVLGAPSRSSSKPLQVGSVKGLIGHTEGASGVVSLIKILLMIHESRIPPQASFSIMNPSIKAIPSDNMGITLVSIPWEDDCKTALINNFGASGSNASMIIKQAPNRNLITNGTSSSHVSEFKCPIYISSINDKGIQAYTTRLRQFLKAKRISGDHFGIENLAFNLNRQSNWSLNRSLVFAAESIDDLNKQLSSYKAFLTPKASPVILCFGGQVASFVGLNREVYDKTTVLRHYLDQCNSTCISVCGKGVYPEIFQREPLSDPSVLQPLLFAMQYSCAMSWIDCGVEPAALVGHSFGELTALCISGVLGLEDAIKLVYGRSKIIKNCWGPEEGSMMAVEADMEDVESLLTASNARLDEDAPNGMASIACLNGPRSFTLAGSAAAIDAVEYLISTRYTSIRHKRLNVTHAFHSSLVDHLKTNLESLGQKLTFFQPRIPLERATRDHDDSPFSAAYVARHMREPVYFSHAVHRLAKQFPQAIWLEAGSNSTITTMANKALGTPENSTFQPVNISSNTSALDQLANGTMNLWKAGLRIHFWPHSTRQTYQYAPMILPPYQFEKHHHYLEFKPPEKQAIGDGIASNTESPSTCVYTRLHSEDHDEKRFRFRINIQMKEFTDVLSTHIIRKTTQTCPVTYLIDMAIQAIRSVRLDLSSNERLHPQIYNIMNQPPIIMTPAIAVYLVFEDLDKNAHAWKFTFSSSPHGAHETVHMSGNLSFQSAEDPHLRLDYGRLERLVPHRRYLQVLENSDDLGEVIQGQNIHQLISGMIGYNNVSRGLQKLVGHPYESAGRVIKECSRQARLDFGFGESFIEVGSIWSNCMAQGRDTSGDVVYTVSGIEQWMKSPDLLGRINNNSSGGPDSSQEWHVLAQHKRTESKDSFLTDIFVFDSTSRSLEEVILGIQFTPVSMTALSKGSTSTGNLEPLIELTKPLPQTPNAIGNISTLPPQGLRNQLAVKPIMSPTQDTSDTDLWIKLQRVLADLSGLELEEINKDDSLADIGIDSLMGMEMAHDIENAFHCVLDNAEIVAIVDVPGVLRYLKSVLGLENGETSVDSYTPAPLDHTSSSEKPSSAPSSPWEDIQILETPLNSDGSLCLPSAIVLEAFHESTTCTDDLLKIHGCAHYLDNVSLKQTRLCLKLISTAFQKLGCDIERARPGEVLQPVASIAKHRLFHDYLYQMLENTRMININGGITTRTAIPFPTQSAEVILEELMQHHGQHGSLHQLTYTVGFKLAEVLSGQVNGPQLLFGDAENRRLVADFYGEFPFNKVYFELMVNFFTELVARLKASSPNPATLKILEMGAGTGGATRVLIPALIKLGIPFEYTFTDLSPSLVAQARKRFKDYPFVKLFVHDISNPPSDPELIGSQHIVMASNAVHATPSLEGSAKNIRKFLRPDGFLMLVEMMETLHCIDLVWGTLEDWWLFDDSRTHAIVDQDRWKEELLSAGYKHVEWTRGDLPESRSGRVIIALASDAGHDLDDPAPTTATEKYAGEHGLYLSAEDSKRRMLAAEEYVRTTVNGFSIPEISGQPVPSSASTCILVTGATGSLGGHIVQHLAGLPSVDKIYCLNRPSVRKDVPADPLKRQVQAMESKGIHVDETMLAKLQTIETDTSKLRLGLKDDLYDELSSQVTHIVHNAYPSNGLRTLTQNENQFVILRNLIDFSANVVALRKHNLDRASNNGSSDFKFTFQFVSSMAAVGVYPAMQGNGEIAVPERSWDIDCALANGYGGSKSVCEHILCDTLGRFPDRFRAMTVRLGQLSGSKHSGYWNHMEVLGFLFKSSQTLAAFPILDGILTWLSLEDTASSLGDLLLRNASDCYPIYHLDNPVHRKWADATPVLTEGLGVPQKGMVPLEEWIRRVRAYPGEDPWDNPAAKAIDFFEHKFEHMSCGGVTLATDKTREHSKTLREVQPLTDDILRKYIQAWKATGFLRSV
ncbi:hypothetical protein FSARC_9422 [Fusarium sarcochroum]|uniref:Polyketide synthase n=1 Tax=Fusarium sarcochroum TaxID=1208366 RepID=A0A8H4TRD3_9HYPO|nr:hypothetical protein FSARC_9422 [Fusarium sarcochroum]